MAKPKAIICDLDQTLAMVGKRDPWDASTCGKDAVRTSLLLVLQALIKDYYVIILTARPLTFRLETYDWLKKNKIPYDLVIHKPFDQKIDLVTAVQFKKRALKFIKTKHTVALAIDDDPDVLTMFKKEKIPYLPIQPIP